MAQPSKRRTLEDLFRPPLDLMCRGTLEMVLKVLKNEFLIFFNIKGQRRRSKK